MAKRVRRRRAKRNASGEATQVDHKLSKRARELYVPGEGWSEEGEDELRHAAADLVPGPSPPRPATPAATEGTVEGAEEQDAGPGHRGLVVASWSGGCRVETATGELLDCTLPSRLAEDQQASIAVGDRVQVTTTRGSATGAGRGQGRRAAPGASADPATGYRVEDVLPRSSRLSRPDPTNPHLERVIAANVDVVVVVASLVRPPLRPALLDRYLIAVERGGAEAVVALNKVDLADDATRRRALTLLAPYREMGIAVVAVSAVTGEGLEELGGLLAAGPAASDGDRLAAFVGHSGVGKSSLLNALQPAIDAATGAVDERAGKGRHTTSSSSLHRLAPGVRVIDTPGIRELGLWQMSLGELREYFPDLQEVALGCRFADCTHTHEPDCAVQRAVASGDLAARRYETYRRILESLGDDR